jgi:hypothetical protein
MTVIRNKRRGRAFQAKLAKMAGGMNIGTLGGEDVKHVEFSYEAKTYDIKAPSKKGREWKGETLMLPRDFGKASTGFSIVELESPNFDTLILMRWYWWHKFITDGYDVVKWESIPFKSNISMFIGNTWMDQAEANAPDAKIPVVVVHTTGRRHPNDIVVIRKLYWKSLLEKFLDKNI